MHDRSFTRMGRGMRSAAARLSIVAVLATLVAVPAVPAQAVAERDLALHWAPVHHQDTDDTDADADYVTRVDFDGDWDTLNDGNELRGGELALDPAKLVSLYFSGLGEFGREYTSNAYR